MLNELMFEVPNPLGDVRLDAFTEPVHILRVELPRGK